MFRHNQGLSRLLSPLAIVLAITIVWAGLAGASGLINAINPEFAREPAMVPPLLAPPPGEKYELLQAGTARITAPDHRSIAQLPAPLASLGQSISVNLPDSANNVTSGVASSDIYYDVLASIKYEGDGHVLLVTTTRPSLAAAQKPTAYGDQTTTLKNGVTAWLTTKLPGDMPNRVVFLQGDLVITLVSNLPVDELESLALHVVIP